MSTKNTSQTTKSWRKSSKKISKTFRNLTHADAYCCISSYLQSIAFKGYDLLVAEQITLEGKALDMLDQSK